LFGSGRSDAVGSCNIEALKAPQQRSFVLFRYEMSNTNNNVSKINVQNCVICQKGGVVCQESGQMQDVKAKP